MGKRAFPLVIVLLAAFLTKAPAHAEKTYLGLNAIDKMKPNGHYIVYVLQGSRWHQAGRLPFDRFFREREMDLSPFLPHDKNITIRLTQKGGGAAHVDNLSLGEMLPTALKGSGDILALKKVSGKDFDVIDAFSKTLEFSFAQNGQNKILRLTARVEGKRVDETPFQFPVANLYRPIDERARFYEYSLNSHRGSLAMDDNLRELSSAEPFFSEFCPTGTGHPAGFTYGWVSNDDENLYVTIDFTPDNTADAEKDYAKVYVKTQTALKEFKVSAAESLWGTAHFAYTGTVSYQHKAYNFKIPLKELDIKHGDKEQLLHLAFSAYGTAAVGSIFWPSIAFDTHNNRYLVVYGREDDVYGRFIDDKGIPIGTEIVISDAAALQTNPSVAYDGVNQRFLVVWVDERNFATTGMNIYGQLVNADGTLYNTASNVNFAICDTGLPNHSFWLDPPSVAYDRVNRRFLVVWEDYRNKDTTSFDIYGQLVNANGTLYNTASNVNFIICNQESSQWGAPSVTYDTVNRRFLVVWEDRRNWGTTHYDIYGQLVNANGTLYNTPSNVNFAISNQEGYQYSPSVTYDTVNRRFLVVWKDERNSATTGLDIYGQLVNTNGTLYNTASNVNFTICNQEAGQYFYPPGSPAVAYDNVNRRFLVVWEDYRNFATTGLDIYGQLVNTNGTLYNTASNVNFLIYNAEQTQKYPFLAYNSLEASFLAAFSTFETGSPDVAFAHIPMPSKKDEGNFYVIPTKKSSAAVIYLE